MDVHPEDSIVLVLELHLVPQFFSPKSRLVTIVSIPLVSTDTVRVSELHKFKAVNLNNVEESVGMLLADSHAPRLVTMFVGWSTGSQEVLPVHMLLHLVEHVIHTVLSTELGIELSWWAVEHLRKGTFSETSFDISIASIQFGVSFFHDHWPQFSTVTTCFHEGKVATETWEVVIYDHISFLTIHIEFDAESSMVSPLLFVINCNDDLVLEDRSRYHMQGCKEIAITKHSLLNISNSNIVNKELSSRDITS